jgi:hypothetical protein
MRSPHNQSFTFHPESATSAGSRVNRMQGSVSTSNAHRFYVFPVIGQALRFRTRSPHRCRRAVASWTTEHCPTELGILYRMVIIWDRSTP